MALYQNGEALSESTGIIMHDKISEILEMYANGKLAWKKRRSTPYTLTFDSVTGWTKRVTQAQFNNNGPSIEYLGNGYNTIIVRGTGISTGKIDYAVGGFYILIDTKFCSYVDVNPGLWFSSLSGIFLDGTPIYYPFEGISGKNVPIDPSKSSQELYLMLNDGGDKYNENQVSLNSLYFHD